VISTYDNLLLYSCFHQPEDDHIDGRNMSVITME